MYDPSDYKEEKKWDKRKAIAVYTSAFAIQISWFVVEGVQQDFEYHSVDPRVNQTMFLPRIIRRYTSIVLTYELRTERHGVGNGMSLIR